MSRNERDSGRGRDEEDRGSRRGRDDDRGSNRGREEERGSNRRGGRDDDGERGGRGSSRGSSSFQYRGRDDSDVRRRSSQGANDFDKFLKDNIKMWKCNDGDNRIRILPPTWDAAKHFGLDVYVHYGVGPDRQSYLCLQKMKGEPDPIAEEREIARRDEDEKYAKELEAKHRVLVYLIDRDNEKEGVQAWAMPSGLDRDIVKISIDKSSGEVLPIDHPDEGYDVTFEKNGKGINTKYEGVSIARRSSPLGRSEWLDFAVDNPLPDQLNFFDYDHIAKVFNGGGGSSSGSSRSSSREESSSRHPSSRDDEDRHDRAGRDSRGSSSSGSSRGGRASEDDDNHGSSRGGSRGGREETSGRGGSRASEEPTWDSIHAMTGDELEDLIDQEKLDIDPREAKNDEDLADWICEEMKIKKVEAPARRRVSNDDDGEGSGASRLRSMRGGRD